MSKGKKRSGARPGSPQPLRGTKGKRKGARLWYVVGLFFFLMIRRPPRSTLFPYTTPSDLDEVTVHDVEMEEVGAGLDGGDLLSETADRKSTRLNSSHVRISYAVFCLKK